MGRRETQESLANIVELCAEIGEQLKWAANSDYGASPFPDGMPRASGGASDPTSRIALDKRKETLRRAVKVAARDIVRAENDLNRGLGALLRAFEPGGPVSRRTTDLRYKSGQPLADMDKLEAARDRRNDREEGHGS